MSVTDYTSIDNDDTIIHNAYDTIATGKRDSESNHNSVLLIVAYIWILVVSLRCLLSDLRIEIYAYSIKKKFQKK